MEVHRQIEGIVEGDIKISMEEQLQGRRHVLTKYIQFAFLSFLFTKEKYIGLSLIHI